MPILIGADVGGSKTAVGVVGRVAGSSRGPTVPGAAVRPGRALASAGIIAEVVRRALARLGKLAGDVLVVGAAGAGRDPERDELREGASRREPGRPGRGDDRHRDRAGRGVRAGPGHRGERGHRQHRGRAGTATGERHRIGGYGWQMGDEGSGYAHRAGRARRGESGRTTAGARAPR